MILTSNEVFDTPVDDNTLQLQHEAGHFLIAYLIGILPRGYTLSSLEALRKEGSLNVQAGTTFVDFEFVEEVSYSYDLSRTSVVCLYALCKMELVTILWL